MNECKKEKREGICFYNCDNIEFMKNKPDNYYDLAIVDPPYGIGFDGEVASMTISPNMNEERKKRWNGRKVDKYKKKDWDKEPPPPEYWKELFRISKDQIIWGGNHFELKQSRGWIFWDKLMDNGFSLADGELAWTSFDKGVKKFTYLWAGFKKAKPENRIHPTQKPIDLYRFCLINYAKKGMNIIDTHGGSMNIAKACDIEGFDIDICEIDAEYFESGVAAFDYHKRQLKLF
jgi:site-specific DNA-methyltransferase (adenine-specific)